MWPSGELGSVQIFGPGHEITKLPEASTQRSLPAGSTQAVQQRRRRQSVKMVGRNGPASSQDAETQEEEREVTLLEKGTDEMR